MTTFFQYPGLTVCTCKTNDDLVKENDTFPLETNKGIFENIHYFGFANDGYVRFRAISSFNKISSYTAATTENLTSTQMKQRTATKIWHMFIPQLLGFEIYSQSRPLVSLYNQIRQPSLGTW